MPTFPICLKELRSILQSDSRLIIDLPEGFQRAAVLIPFILREKGWALVFTRRTENVPHHKKEISFPGGRYEEEQDKDLIHTALREVREELGINKIVTFGILDDLLTISNYVVTPVLGFIENNRELDNAVIDTSEIDYILEIMISDLTVPKQFSVKKMTYRDRYSFQVPFFDYHGEIIWGATGRILVNLLKKINLLPPDCRFTLMKQDLWHEDVNIDNGLDYLNNLKILKDKK
ncbi:MAG: NUDIX hydrolase [Promethearchaeota archaeon]